MRSDPAAAHSERHRSASPGGDVLGNEPHLWEGRDADSLARAWALPLVSVHEWVGSTNDVARELARAGAPSGTLVLADEQRAGRGRGGHSWSSPAGVGLWCSLIVRGITAPALGTLPIRVALAIAPALDPWIAGGTRVKWPNDLLVDVGSDTPTGIPSPTPEPVLKKVAGILCESAWDAGAPRYAIVGIGINLLQRAEDFPPEIATHATSLHQASGRDVSRFEVASAVIDGLRPLFAGTPSPDDDLPSLLAERDALRGRLVEVREPNEGRLIARGMASGIDDRGSLLVRADGAVIAATAGSVRIVGD